MNDLGTRVRLARIEKRMTQKQLAKAVGISQSTLGALELGNNKSTKAIVSVARVLDVNPTWLETGKGIKEKVAASGEPEV